MKVFRLIRPKHARPSNITSLTPMYWLRYEKEHLEIHMITDCFSLLVQFFARWEEVDISKYLGEDFVKPTNEINSFGAKSCLRVKKEDHIIIYFPFTPKAMDFEATKIDWKMYKKIGFLLSLIFGQLNFILSDHYEKNEFEECPISQVPQLFSVDTIAKPEGGLHSASLGLCISVPATQFLLKQQSLSEIPNGNKRMLKHYLAMFPEKNKDTIWYIRSTLIANMRKHATLQFNTSGNCACMGNIPEERSADRGMEIHSHNVDNVSQQFNLLVGIATLWDWVREEIKKEKGL